MGISLYTMWSALAPPPLDSVEMVLHFMQLVTPSPLTLVSSPPLSLLFDLALTLTADKIFTI